MKKPKNPWKKLGSRIVYQNKWFKVKKDDVMQPNGEKGEYNIIVTPPGVFVVALTEKQEVYMIEMFRYPTGIYSLEVPGGNTDGQSPLKAAKRELWEETGLKAKKWTSLGSWYAWNGVAAEKDFLYLAEGLTQTEKNEMKEEGIQKIKKLPLKKVLQLIKSGKISDGQTIIVIAKLCQHLNLLK